METPELVVVRDAKTVAQVAREVLEAINAAPHEHEVSQLAEKIGVPEDQIAHVLHNYGPDGHGGVEQRPEGQGGGWLPEEVAEQHRTIRNDQDDENIGYRWPDGELRDVVFDKEDPSHLSMLGVQKHSV